MGKVEGREEKNNIRKREERPNTPNLNRGKKGKGNRKKL